MKQRCFCRIDAVIPRCLNWATLMVMLLACVAAPAGTAEQADVSKPAPDPRAFEVRFLDDSVLRVRLAEQQVEIQTKHGKLVVPADQIKRLYFAQRIDTAIQQKIDKAVAALADPAAADAASDQLLGFKEQSAPALRRAAASADKRLAEAAAALLSRIDEQYEARVASVRGTDLIETDDGKIVGRLTASSLRIQTKQFGTLTMKVADARSLRSQSLIKDEPEPEPKDVQPDPGNMKPYETMIGKTFRFQVTGQSGSIWGSDTYTADSLLAAAAVHAGVLKIGEAGVVEVKVVVPPASFTGSTRNGITTRSWGSYPGAYKIIKSKKDKKRE